MKVLCFVMVILVLDQATEAKVDKDEADVLNNSLQDNYNGKQSSEDEQLKQTLGHGTDRLLEVLESKKSDSDLKNNTDLATKDDHIDGDGDIEKLDMIADIANEPYVKQHHLVVRPGDDEVELPEQVAIDDALWAKLAADPAADLGSLSNVGKWAKDGNLVVIPYELHYSINSKKKQAIEEAAARYKAKTCIRWIPRATADQKKSYVQFVGNQGGCGSIVGYVGNYGNMKDDQGVGKQDISIGDGCGYTGIVMHEMLHCLGFYHEQSRPDRNKYLKFFQDNVQQRAAHNFDVEVSNRRGGPYDIKSIMHYGPNDFTKNGKPVLLKREPPESENLVTYRKQRDGFTDIDLEKLNRFYGCSNKNTPEPETPKPEKAKPVNGRWGAYGAYGACSKRCGGGTRMRTRKCNNPAPSNGGSYCVGSSAEISTCNNNPCSESGSGSKGVELEFKVIKSSAYVPYGWHKATKSEVEYNKDKVNNLMRCWQIAELADGYNINGPCYGSKIQISRYGQSFGDIIIAKEKSSANPVNGQWGAYGAYSTCSKTCGGGTRMRTRKCNNPAPSNGGSDCAGYNSQISFCNSNACSGSQTVELEFKVIKSSAYVPYGWRKATKSEVESNKDKVNNLMSCWMIAELADGYNIKGPCYGSTIQQNRYGQSFGDQVIARTKSVTTTWVYGKDEIVKQGDLTKDHAADDNETLENDSITANKKNEENDLGETMTQYLNQFLKELQ